MKKSYIFICLLLIILSVVFINKTGVSEDTIDFEKIKSELSLIPKDYYIDNALSDGCFVIPNGEVKFEHEIIDQFVSDSEEGKATSITIVQYTFEGDPIITKIIYDGNKYYGIEDNTRDTFGSSEYIEFEFKYLKAFTEKDEKKYFLLNNNEVTYDELLESVLSSNSKDWIEHQYLFEYKESKCEKIK